MALPSTLRILLEDQAVLEIVDAVCWTRKHVATYDGSTYRNLFPNQKVRLDPIQQPTELTTINTETTTLQVPGTISSTVIANNAASTYTDTLVGDDSVTAIEPRIWKKVRTRVEFWDAATPGVAMTLSATTVSGSATVTVPDNSVLTPTQEISGTGIPTGAKILSIPITSSTTVILTHQATASATVTATLTGANYVGGYWEDEAQGDAPNVSILQ